MGVVCQSSSFSSFSSSVHSTAGGVCEGSSGSRGYSGNEFYPVSRASFFRSQEEFDQETGNSRPVNPEQINSVSIIQNDNDSRRTSGDSGKRLRDFNRFEGCVLAYSGSSLLCQVPRVCNRGKEVSFQSDAVWTQCGSKNLHQDLQADSSGAQTARSPSGGLFRRLAHMGGVRGGVQEIHGYCNSSSAPQGFLNQLGQISSRTTAKVSMVGSDVGHSFQYNVSPHRQGRVAISRLISFFEQNLNFQKTPRTNSRKASVCCHSRSCGESSSEDSQLVLQGSCSKRCERHLLSVSPCSEESPKEMAETRGSFDLHSSSSSSTIFKYLHGRVHDRLGSPLFRRAVAEGVVVGPSSGSPHQYIGASHHLSGPTETSHPKVLTCSCPFGQCDCSCLPQPKGLGQVVPLEQLDDLHSSAHGQKGSLCDSLPYSRGQKCHCRRSVEAKPDIIRMEVGQGHLSGDMQ